MGVCVLGSTKEEADFVPQASFRYVLFSSSLRGLILGEQEAHTNMPQS